MDNHERSSKGVSILKRLPLEELQKILGETSRRLEELLERQRRLLIELREVRKEVREEEKMWRYTTYHLGKRKAERCPAFRKEGGKYPAFICLLRECETYSRDYLYRQHCALCNEEPEEVERKMVLMKVVGAVG